MTKLPRELQEIADIQSRPPKRPRILGIWCAHEWKEIEAFNIRKQIAHTEWIVIGSGYVQRCIYCSKIRQWKHLI